MTLRQRLSLLLRGYYLAPCAVPGWGWQCVGRDGMGAVGDTPAQALERHQGRVAMRRRAASLIRTMKGL